MQTAKLSRAAVLILLGVMAGCSKTPEPSAGAGAREAQVAPHAPIVTSDLHTVTLIAAQPLDAALVALGYTRVALPPNYPQSIPVEAGVWDVPVEAAGAASYWQPAEPGAPRVRAIAAEVPIRSDSNPGADEAFYREVLNTAVPSWLANAKLPEGARIHALTWLTGVSTMDIRNQLRASKSHIVYGPVAISTPYLGDHEVISVRSPGGVIVELVRNSSQ
jgi:hypothetical protein